VTMTDDEILARLQRLEAVDQRFDPAEAQLAQFGPAPPPVSEFARKTAARQAELREQRATAKAIADAQEAERQWLAEAPERERAEAEKRRQHQLWRDNAPRREAALAELETLEDVILEARAVLRGKEQRQADLLRVVLVGEAPHPLEGRELEIRESEQRQAERRAELSKRLR